MTSVKICVFDAYGTLFDVAAAARAAAAEPGRDAFAAVWPQLSELWRAKQLEYTWLRAAMGVHTDFWQVTQSALDVAMAGCKLDDPPLRERLLQLYFELDAFPEALAALKRLKAAGMTTAILSNGAPKMLAAAVDSAGLGDGLDDVLSVESVGVFKPDRRVYDMVPARYGCTPPQAAFISSNGWDACAAAAYGFHTLWVNRRDAPMDRLTAEPHHIVSDLAAAADHILAEAR